MKKLALAFLLTTATVGTASYVAFAQGPGPKFEAMLADVDTNLDGNITKAEIEAKKAADFATADTSRDGMLTFDEFETFALAEKARREAARRERMFTKLDTDGDGFLTETELAAKSSARMEKRFDRIDTNGDGMISEVEREAVQEKMQKRRGKHKRGMLSGEE